jgi:hypothetical protein
VRPDVRFRWSGAPWARFLICPDESWRQAANTPRGGSTSGDRFSTLWRRIDLADLPADSAAILMRLEVVFRLLGAAFAL